MARLVLYDEDLFVLIKALEQKNKHLLKTTQPSNRATNSKKQVYIHDLIKKLDRTLQATVSGE